MKAEFFWPLLLSAGCALAQSSEFISDHPELVLSATQDWGVLGYDTAAHAPDQTGAPLRIGGKDFAKGLGHHANGVITLLTDGCYESFDAEVGLQPCMGGSVNFRVFVDDQLKFTSGTLRSGDEPKPVHVSLAGAQEVRLEAKAAGDGISCDMANWAEARLTAARNAPKQRGAESSVDLAPFARVVTWDASRTNGSRANRIEEFHADDLFTETELKPDGRNFYAVRRQPGGLGCIGLQWLNRRALREVTLEFAESAVLPPADGMRVEGWFGESVWQGNWKRLNGDFVRDGHRISLKLAAKAGVVQTHKIRWIFSADAKPARVRLSAFTRSSWATTNLYVQLERPARVNLRLWNGEFGESSTSGRAAQELAWDFSQPFRTPVRYSRPSSFKSDPTVLQFRFARGEVSVAIEEVLANDCVYLPDFGLFVARAPLPVTLAEYKRRIAGQQTILEEVRARADQTFAQAMAKTHHETQREGPVLLSLAGNNDKFVVEREGSVRFQATTNVATDWFASAGELRPHFGDAKNLSLTRRLDGGWLPIPVITKEHDGVLLRQRSYVAPLANAANANSFGNHRSVCVVEFTLTNTLDHAAEAKLSLEVVGKSRQKQRVHFESCDRGWTLRYENHDFGLVAVEGGAVHKSQLEGETLSVSSTLPAHSGTTLTVFLSPQPTDFAALPTNAELRSRTETYWHRALAPAAQIATPDPLLNDVIRSSQVRCLIDARNEADGKRVAAWIAAVSYGPLESEAHSVIRGMDFLGHGEFAQRALDFFVQRYNTNGFLTTGYTTFGTAWHLWSLGEHYQLTRDRQWLRQVAPEIARVGHWIVRQTEKTRKLDAGGHSSPESGLMPPGVLADWNSFAYHFAMNAYYVAALHELGEALGDMGHRDASFFKRHASALRESTLRAYRWTQARSPALPLRNGTWIPHYPSQVHSPGKLGDFFPGQDAGRSWCYDVELGAHQLVPTGVLEPRSREVTRLMDHMEDVQFLADGWFDYPAATNQADWFNLGGFSKVQPYYTRNCEIYAQRDDVKPFVRSYFNSLAALLNPEVLTLWEHFRHSGAWDKTHETGYFLHQTRTMLVQERGRELWLAPFITSNWLRDGERVAVKNAPTSFGSVSYEISSCVAQGFIEARIEPPTRRAPKQIVLRLRHPDGKRIRSVTVNGKRHTTFDPASETVVLKPYASVIYLRAGF